MNIELIRQFACNCANNNTYSSVFDDRRIPANNFYYDKQNVISNYVLLKIASVFALVLLFFFFNFSPVFFPSLFLSSISFVFVFHWSSFGLLICFWAFVIFTVSLALNFFLSPLTKQLPASPFHIDFFSFTHI